MGRQKRSISLPADLAVDIEEAAAEAGLTVSAWMAEVARHRLRLDAGRKGIEEWEAENGPLTEEELAEARARFDRMMGRTSPAGEDQEPADHARKTA